MELDYFIKIAHRQNENPNLKLTRKHCFEINNGNEEKERENLKHISYQIIRMPHAPKIITI